jgi:hypothetical protein
MLNIARAARKCRYLTRIPLPRSARAFSSPYSLYDEQIANDSPELKAELKVKKASMRKKRIVVEYDTSETLTAGPPLPPESAGLTSSKARKGRKRGERHVARWHWVMTNSSLQSST